MDVSFLEYWADVFVARGYSRYLTLSQFLRAPRNYCEQFDGLDGARPLLPAQQRVQRWLDRQERAEALVASVSRLEKQVAHLPRRNGAVVEPLKHHRNPR